MTARIYVMLGGFVGPDGYADSLGMVALERRIQAQFPKTECQVWRWDLWQGLSDAIKALSHDDKVILIGYSGGGSRATWVANAIGGRHIDLMVLYDPSPAWQMYKIGANVARAVCYYNRAPWFFGLGGGMLTGSNVVIKQIAEEHALVQSDGNLHQNTIAEIEKVLA